MAGRVLVPSMCATDNNSDSEGGKNSAHNVDQYEKLKSSYAADEIMNAERVRSALKDDPAHRAASFLSKEQLASGKTYSFTGVHIYFYKLKERWMEIKVFLNIF